MKFLKRFKRKEKDTKDLLYKKVTHNEFLIYDEDHDKEDFTKDEIESLKTIFKKSMCGQNTPTCITLFKMVLGVSIDPFYVIEKYKDEWFLLHTCKLSDKRGRQFDVIDHYFCDTFDGVKNLLEEQKVR